MSHLLKVILTFQNQSPKSLTHLSNLIYTSESLIDEKIIIISPTNKILHYSNDHLQNIKLSHALSYHKISPEFCKKFKEDYAKFKIEIDNYHQTLNSKTSF